MTVMGRWGLDAFLVLFAAGEAVAIVLSAGQLRWLAAASAVVSTLVLIARRWQPLVVSIASLLAIGACLFMLRDAPTMVFFSLMTTFAIIAAINSIRDAVIAWLVGAALIAVGVWGSNGADPEGTDPLGDYLLTLGLCTVMWCAGLLLSRRTRQAAVMALRLELTELEQVRAVQEERNNIARELHDVVSHGLTVVVVQTLAARGALDDLPIAVAAEADRHMAAVEDAAREALADMRTMLGLLQSDDLDASAPTASSTRLADIPQLADRARAAGIEVDDSGVDATLRLRQALELSVYRIVQEALTNVIKHAPGAHVQVRLARRSDDVSEDVRVDVTDDGGQPAGGKLAVVDAGGRGVIGMRERVSTYGGTLQAGPTVSGGYAVHAVLPISGTVSRGAVSGGAVSGGAAPGGAVPDGAARGGTVPDAVAPPSPGERRG